MKDTVAFWSIRPEEIFRRLGTSAGGLSTEEAGRRLAAHGPNLLKPRKRVDPFFLLASQFKSPIILILIAAAVLSLFVHEITDALIILSIIFISGLLGFWQEKGAADAAEGLLEVVQVKTTALRDGEGREIPVEEVVPGDILFLSAGHVVAGDCLVLEAKDCFVNEAALTGETFPVEKTAGAAPADAPLNLRSNALFMGTDVVSGTAHAVVVATGTRTEFGKIAERLKLRPPETEFERGVRRFGYFLMEVTLILVMTIFAVNVFFERPVLDSFLFSLALAVGLTPQLLPAIISINLSQGARQMARRKVIVKRLASIENFGSMNVLCSDKTGTLTEGKVRVHSSSDVNGRESERVLFHAYLNAYFQTGFVNPIDAALRECGEQFDVSGYEKLDELPYDSIRKRLSLLISKDDRTIMVTKGALANILAVCSSAEIEEGRSAPLGEVHESVRRQYEQLSGEGFRTLGVAYREIPAGRVLSRESETDMIFLGFLVLHDPPKPGIAKILGSLEDMGIALKIITGDNRLIASHVTRQVGLPEAVIVSGPEMDTMSDEALRQQVNDVNVFAEVEPNQKERIILALRKTGNVVGYMGDGINDASALHAADVGISVDEAVDVAKNAADIVLLEKDLRVLIDGVTGGRVTFANTLKYVFMATSANFGNMFSVAGASFFLPFLPMLPKQILLTNLLTDFPEMTIATDSVDPELTGLPRRWDIKFIRNFMITFGPLSSVFDLITFGVLLLILHSSKGQFRSGWFVESVVSASLIVLVIRSRRPFFQSRPGKYLLLATPLVAGVAVVLPYTPIGRLLGFVPLSGTFIAAMCLIVVAYVISAELVKRIFWARVKF